ncbi:guanine nucleotide-binding protein G(s) subunit alpha-like [Dysidea avara]|uniref:guanine nucleotide-binding protein G(s) subunit alpha-like n=1 Tax=Dysidea avara TaxID=196820 RepID=UPI00332B11D2
MTNGHGAALIRCRLPELLAGLIIVGMSCFGSAESRRKKEEERQRRRFQKERNKEINDKILEEKRDYRSTHRVLLLGTKNSGKSTVMKHLALLADDDPSEEVWIERVHDIHLNIREIVTTVLKAMAIFNPPFQLQNPESEEHAKYVLEVASKPNFDFPSEFFDRCFNLWNDPGMVQCYGRSDGYQLLSCAHYFMESEKFKAISMPTFIPSNEDILQSHSVTKGMQEIKFTKDMIKYHVVDINGQQRNYSKWTQCFSDITAIVFIVDCSSYNLYLREDCTKNCLEEAMELFDSIWGNKWLINVSVVMFLNKTDLLKQKILEGRFKIESRFPHYAYYQTSPDTPRDSGDTDEVRKAKGFIRDLFKNITEAKPDRRHSLYTYFTIATDIENIRGVFNSLRDIAQKQHLRQYELL